MARSAPPWPWTAFARRTAAVCLAAPLLACAHATAPGPSGWHYAVTVAPDLGRLDVSLCFRDVVPARLVADHAAAVRYVVDARAAGSGKPLTVDRDAGQLLTAGAGKCVAYGVDIARMIAEVDGDAMAVVAGALAGSPDLWLWRPQRLPDAAEVTLAFALPDGVAVSAPWPRGADARYRLSTTAFTWASQVVIGRFVADRFTAAGTDFQVAVIDRPRKISAAGVRRWISTAAETVAGLYGGAFPAAAMQVVVVPYPGGGDPVYFGMALRGGGPSVLLLISGGADDDAFPGEWVAIHEFLHHGMPFVERDAAWMSEGFVTYYTEVLRTRAGLRSERAAWDALLSGFARGRRSGTDAPLVEESARMHDTHAYQRVYWGGAALALLADVALREAGSSLDAAMRHLDACCGEDRRIWTADAVLRELDRWLASTLGARAPSLRALVEPVLQRTGGPWSGPEAAFPELSAVYRKLGVNMVDGEPTLDESASIAHVRRAIFTAP